MKPATAPAAQPTGYAIHARPIDPVKLAKRLAEFEAHYLATLRQEGRLLPPPEQTQ